MSVSLDQARKNLNSLENFNPQTTNIDKFTDKIIEIIKTYPEILFDKDSTENLCQITEQLYSLKNKLPEEKQKMITEFFQKSHHITPTAISGLSNHKESAKQFFEEHSTCEAVLPDIQDYPIPLDLLKNEEVPCDSYFNTVEVALGDGAVTNVSQGMLANFSKRVKDHGPEAPMKLKMEMLNRHQFDTLIAFLQTQKIGLINEENALPLLLGASFLMIPELLEACSYFLLPNLDIETAVHLVNALPSDTDVRIMSQLEMKISDYFNDNLSKPVVETEFKEKLEMLEKTLKNPFKLTLLGEGITNEKVSLLKNLPIQELSLQECPNLTNEVFSVIKDNPSIKNLVLSGNEWVDSDTLNLIPSNIKNLSLINSKNFSGEGLRLLESKRLTSLELTGCHQLKDEDYNQLPLNLNRLKISLCQGLANKGMTRIGAMQNLRDLTIRSMRISPENLKHLPRQLESLDLVGSGLNDDGIGAVAEMNNLTSLVINGTNVTDKALSQLPPNLRQLGLSHCKKITNRGVADLAKRKELKSITLFSNPKITRNAINKFSKQVIVNWREPSPAQMIHAMSL